MVRDCVYSLETEKRCEVLSKFAGIRYDIHLVLQVNCFRPGGNRELRVVANRAPVIPIKCVETSVSRLDDSVFTTNASRNLFSLPCRRKIEKYIASYRVFPGLSPQVPVGAAFLN